MVEKIFLVVFLILFLCFMIMYFVSKRKESKLQDELDNANALVLNLEKKNNLLSESISEYKELVKKKDELASSVKKIKSSKDNKTKLGDIMKLQESIQSGKKSPLEGST